MHSRPAFANTANHRVEGGADCVTLFVTEGHSIETLLEARLGQMYQCYNVFIFIYFFFFKDLI